MPYQFTGLKNKNESNSTWEGAFYQTEWVKIDSRWVILVSPLYIIVAANAFI